MKGRTFTSTSLNTTRTRCSGEVSYRVHECLDEESGRRTVRRRRSSELFESVRTYHFGFVPRNEIGMQKWYALVNFPWPKMAR